MAEIIEQDSGKKEGGKRRAKKGAAGVDMTPMVDLMCLLITFFMLTTAFSKPKVLEITMPSKEDPKDKKEKPIKIAAKRTYTIIIGEKDEVFWYNGAIEKGQPLPVLYKTTFGDDGIRKVLLDKNRKVFTEISELKEKVVSGKLIMADSTLNRRIKEIKKGDPNSPIVLIKATEKAKYGNIVDIIDEMAICNIGSFAVVDITPDEVKLLESAPK